MDGISFSARGSWEGVPAAIKQVESLVALDLRTSKRGEFAAPLPKRYSGPLGGLGTQ